MSTVIAWCTLVCALLGLPWVCVSFLKNAGRLRWGRHTWRCTRTGRLHHRWALLWVEKDRFHAHRVVAVPVRSRHG